MSNRSWSALCRVSFALLGATAISGCVRATFTQTDDGFTPYLRDRLPRAFVDNLPPVAYRSVGIIEVRGPGATELGEIIYAAREKGKEVGCDLVVDRRIHVPVRQDAGVQRRWVIALSDNTLREKRAPTSEWVGVSVSRASRDVLGSTSSTPIYTPVYVEPQKTYEFICGVFLR